MDKVTIDTILNSLKGWVEAKQPIDAHTWTDAAQKLNILIGDEHDNLFDFMQKVAKAKAEYIIKGDSVAKSKVIVEASDDYREMMKQRAKIGMIEEAIRIAKIQARLKDNEYRNQ